MSKEGAVLKEQKPLGSKPKWEVGPVLTDMLFQEKQGKNFINAKSP